MFYYNICWEIFLKSFFLNKLYLIIILNFCNLVLKTKKVLFALFDKRPFAIKFIFALFDKRPYVHFLTNDPARTKDTNYFCCQFARPPETFSLESLNCDKICLLKNIRGFYLHVKKLPNRINYQIRFLIFLIINFSLHLFL